MNGNRASTRPATADLVARPPASDQVLRVSRYDRVAALLVALLIITGAIVLILVVVWLSSRVFAGQAPVTPRLIEVGGDGGQALGAAGDFADVGESDIEELLDPQLTETFDAVMDAVSTQAATEESEGGQSAVSSLGGGGGDAGQPGSGGGPSHLARWQRWELAFSATNLQSYARQLDQLGIELGAAGGSDQIDYAYQLSQNPPRHRRGLPQAEKRMYMTWRFGSLRNADQALLNRAGIKTDQRIIMQFIPQELEERLAAVEREYLQKTGQSLADIQKTIFRVEGADGQYQFAVKEIRTLSERLR